MRLIEFEESVADCFNLLCFEVFSNSFLYGFKSVNSFLNALWLRVQLIGSDMNLDAAGVIVNGSYPKISFIKLDPLSLDP